jgi:hypothetical protein
MLAPFVNAILYNVGQSRFKKGTRLRSTGWLTTTHILNQENDVKLHRFDGVVLLQALPDKTIDSKQR